MRTIGLKEGLAGASLLVIALTGAAEAADPVLSLPEDPTATQRLAIAFGVGVQAFELPSLAVGAFAAGQGSFDRETDATAVGPVFSAAIASTIGDTPYSIELSGAYSLLSGDDSALYSFTGPGALLISGPTNLTAGRIDLSTSAGPAGGSASARATIAGPSGGATSDQSTASPPGSDSRQAGWSPLDGAGAFTATGANGSTPDGTAFGAVGNGREFAIAAVGNLDGYQMTTTTDEDFEQGLLEARIGRTTSLSENWSVTPALGPSFRHISRDLTTQMTLAGLPGSVAERRLPNVSVVTREDLSADYWGGVAGATLTGQMTDSLFVSFGGDLGLAYYDADYSASSRAMITSNLIPGVFDTGSVQGPGQSDDDVTYLGRIKAGLAYRRGATVLSIGAQAEYLADVPTLSRGSYADFSQTNATLAVGGPTGGANSRLGSDDAWNYGANVGFTYRF